MHLTNTHTHTHLTGSYGSLARFRSLSRLRKITDTTVMAAAGDYADFQHLDREFESIVLVSLQRKCFPHILLVSVYFTLFVLF